MSINLTCDKNLLSIKDYLKNSIEGSILACCWQRTDYLACVGLGLIIVMNFGDFIFSTCSECTALIWAWTFSGFAFIILIFLIKRNTQNQEAT